MNEYSEFFSKIEQLISNKPSSREASVARTNLQTAELFAKVHGSNAHKDIQHYLEVAELWAQSAPAYAEGTVPNAGK